MASGQEQDFGALPEDRPLSPLPLGETVRQVLPLLLANAPAIARLALLPVLIGFVLAVGTLLLDPGAPLRLFAAGVNLYLLVWFAASVFRLQLLGPGPVLARPLPRWGEAELRLALRGLGVIALSMLATLPATLIFGSLGGGIGADGPQPGLWMVGPFVVAVVVSLGLSFVLPAAAVGRGYGFKRAWRETRGVLVPLFGLFAVIVVPVDLLIVVVDLLMQQFQLATELVVPRVAVGTAANYLSVALASSVVALAFAKRTGWRRPT